MTTGKIQTGQVQKWSEYDSGAYAISLPKAEGIDFLKQIAGHFDATFQELMREISNQITGKTVFWLNGKRVECKISLSESKKLNKYRPYNLLWIMFFDRSKRPVSWTDQSGVRFIFERKLGPYESSPSLGIGWLFEDYCVAVSREVEHNKAFCTPSCLNIHIPMDYSDTPDIMPGIKAEGGKLEIDYPFILEPDGNNIIVPSCFFPKTFLLPNILDDISGRGVNTE